MGYEVRGMGCPDKGEGTKEKDGTPAISEKREANSKQGARYGVQG